ncbi:MAG: FUN14 domain-containing protein [Haloarculaceae archaeon]
MALDIPGLGMQMGGSALIGGVIGFTAKKVAKVIAVIVGLELVLFKFLESRGILQVNWERLGGTFEGLASDAGNQTQTLIETFISTAGIGAGFAAGFAVGFKRA